MAFKHIMNDITPGKTIYVLHLKEYQIQSLFHSKMGMEPNVDNTPYTTDILWETARQVVDTQQGDSNLKDFIKYFQHQGLL